MEQLMEHLLGADNALRNNAEQVISGLEKEPEAYLAGLMNVSIFLWSCLLSRFYVLPPSVLSVTSLVF